MVNIFKISFFTLLFTITGCCSEPLEPLAPAISGNPMRVEELGSFVDQLDPAREVISIGFSQNYNVQTINIETVIVEGMDAVSFKTEPPSLQISGIPNCAGQGCQVKITLKGTGSQTITNTAGYPLDGNNDNIDGGDFVQTFIF